MYGDVSWLVSGTVEFGKEVTESEQTAKLLLTSDDPVGDMSEQSHSAHV